MQNYIVSDWREAHINGKRTWHWRTMAVTNSIVAARKFAGPDSIITAHTFEEADQIHSARVLPAEYEVVA
jgi:hypothetical protein